MDITLTGCKNFIASRLPSGGMFHAIIISGQNCPEKRRIVELITASILCSSGGARPCGKCSGCKKVMSGIHPDVYTLSPADGKREISVAQVRDMRATVSVIPNDGDNKVYIINDADCMNTAAQNVLLKTLEEPPSFAYFILSASSAGLLLPTVRSRCAELRFVNDESSKIPAEAVEIADKFVKIYLSGDRLGTARLINSLEKTEKGMFPYIAAAVEQAAAEAIKRSPSENHRRLAVKLISAFDDVSVYLDMNVGVVHILGLLMSRLV